MGTTHLNDVIRDLPLIRLFAFCRRFVAVCMSKGELSLAREVVTKVLMALC